jgi:hypothetical protein
VGAPEPTRRDEGSVLVIELINFSMDSAVGQDRRCPAVSRATDPAQHPTVAASPCRLHAHRGGEKHPLFVPHNTVNMNVFA